MTAGYRSGGACHGTLASAAYEQQRIDYPVTFADASGVQVLMPYFHPAYPAAGKTLVYRYVRPVAGGASTNQMVFNNGFPACVVEDFHDPALVFGPGDGALSSSAVASCLLSVFVARWIVCLLRS